jgi:hypothetical protein
MVLMGLPIDRGETPPNIVAAPPASSWLHCERERHGETPVSVLAAALFGGAGCDLPGDASRLLATILTGMGFPVTGHGAAAKEGTLPERAA